MEVLIFLVVIGIFLWRRYSGMFHRIVEVECIRVEGKVAYCSFIWDGEFYNNGVIHLEDGMVIGIYFNVVGFDAAHELWELEPIMTTEL